MRPKQELTAARQQLADLKLEAERARGRLEYQAKQIEADRAAVGRTGEEKRRLLDDAASGTSSGTRGAQRRLGSARTEFAGAQAQLDAKGSERQSGRSGWRNRNEGSKRRGKSVLRMLGECVGAEEPDYAGGSATGGGRPRTARARARSSNRKRICAY